MTIIGDAYRWLYSRISSRPTNFSWVIENQLAGSGLPMTFDQFKWLKDHGIKTIVTVREISLPSRWFTEIGNDKYKSKDSDNKDDNINYLHLEVEDYKAPTIAELKSTTVFLESEIESNRRPVLVHCAAGKGRTGTILAAYLLKKEHLNAEEAIRKIRKLRPGSIQTQIQEDAIRQYASSLSTD